MAKYRVGPEKFYDGAQVHQPGAVVELPDSVAPSLTFEPLDKPAEKAMEKRLKDAKARNAPVDDKLREHREALARLEAERALSSRSLSQPQTMSELAQRGGRAADAEPV